MKTKFIFALAVICTVIAALSSCSNSPAVNASIVGTWTLTTERIHYTSNGSTVRDTTVPGLSGTGMTFNSNGTFTNNGFFSQSGTYTYAGSLLTITAGTATDIYPVVTLDAHTLALQVNDSVNSSAPLVINQTTYSFTR